MMVVSTMFLPKPIMMGSCSCLVDETLDNTLKFKFSFHFIKILYGNLCMFNKVGKVIVICWQAFMLHYYKLLSCIVAIFYVALLQAFDLTPQPRGEVKP